MRLPLFSYLVMNRVVDRMVHRVMDRVVDRMMHWMMDRMVDRMVDRMMYWRMMLLCAGKGAQTDQKGRCKQNLLHVVLFVLVY